MTPRDRNIVIALFAVIVLGGGGFAGYTLVISPLDDVDAAIQKVQGEIEDSADKEGLESRVDMMQKTVMQLPTVKRQSLPPNVDVAKAQYIHVIERLLQNAKIKSGRIPDPRTIDRRAPITPELATKKPAYTILEFRLDMDKVDIWQVSDFLDEFYKLDLLHQITEINISRENKVSDSRAGLKVHFTIEAISLDGVETRSTLFPAILGATLTPTGKAVAAIAGGAAAEVVNQNPDLEMKYIPAPGTNRLATHPRDYSYLARNDIFYGTLPPERQSSGGTTTARKDDIASHIRLVMLSDSTAGTSSAFIMDIASPYKYTISLNQKDGMKVDRLYRLSGAEWKSDLDYVEPKGILKFSSATASTKRAFRVIAIEDNALIVEDVGKADERIDAKGPPRGPGNGGGRGQGGGAGGAGGGFNRGGGAGGRPAGGNPGGGVRPGPGAGPGGGRPATPPGPAVAPGAPGPGAALPAPLPQNNEKVAADLPAEPMLYRWVVGKSLKDLERAKLPADEARKIMSRVPVAQKPLNE